MELGRPNKRLPKSDGKDTGTRKRSVCVPKFFSDLFAIACQLARVVNIASSILQHFTAILQMNKYGKREANQFVYDHSN